MANGRKRITNTSSPNTEKKRQRLQAKFSEYKHPEFDSEFCWGVFILAQLEKGNSEQTISFYKRFYKKYSLFWAEAAAKDFPDFTMKQQPIEHLTNDGNRIVFVSWLEKQGFKAQFLRLFFMLHMLSMARVYLRKMAMVEKMCLGVIKMLKVNGIFQVVSTLFLFCGQLLTITEKK